MATTKKVAQRRGTQTKKAVKKTVSSKRSPKKVAKKTTKKVVRKKNSSQKKSANTGVVKTSFDQKLQTIELLHTQRNTRTGIHTTEKTSSKKRISKLMVKPVMHFAVLLPSRFPLQLDMFAIQTARMSGVAFVLLGGIFTIFFSQYLWSQGLVVHEKMPFMLLAESFSGSSSYSSTSSSSSSVSDSVSSSGSYANNNTVVERPPAYFATDVSAPWNDEIQILTEVADATRVKILVFKASYTDPVYLGEADLVGLNKWSYKWDTRKLPDGNYKIAADIYNVYNMTKPYRQADDEYRLVENHPSATPDVVVNTTASSTATTSTPTVSVDKKPKLHITSDAKTPISDTAALNIEVEKADQVRLEVTHKDSGSRNILGRAHFIKNNIWRYFWDTNQFDDGEYVISAKVTNAFGTYEDGDLTLTVQNNIPDTQVVTDTEDDDDPIDTDTEDDAKMLDDSPVDKVAVTDEKKAPAEVPDLTMAVVEESTLSGNVDISIQTGVSEYVEVYAVYEESYIQRYLGKAKRVDLAEWLFVWDTKNSPNGNYTLFSKAKNSFGVGKSNFVKVRVHNGPLVIEKTVAQIAKEDAIKKAQEIELQQKIADDQERIKRLSEQASTSVVLDSGTQVNTYTADTDVDYIFDRYAERIDVELQRFAMAYRSKDADMIDRVSQRLTALKKELLNTSGDISDKKAFERDVNARMEDVIQKYTVAIEKTNTLISKRASNTVFEDSDSDGVADYDEVALYGTDPFSADTDNDGFTDGAEIVSGYNPSDPSREVAVAYESPKETGIVRTDILKVETIETVVDDVVQTTEPESTSKEILTATSSKAEAVLTGKALPSSFATLYIFSTPIVVTVKTDENGGWKYRFDKELEDGEHNVYVGITDNAGRIVAKSEPFTFVKEAQAFSAIDVTEVVLANDTPQEESFLAGYMMYLILSLSVVSIGLVLILLGLHLDTRGRRFTETDNTDVVT